MDSLTHWEVLFDRPHATIRRRGRFVLADLRGAHRVISTSARNGGQTEHVLHLVNHQSCEGAGHDERFRVITERGQEGYHDAVCAEVDRPADRTATMGTAANMNYLAIVTAADAGVEATAAVTAGVESNATCAGDPAQWRENPGGVEKVPHVAGTINTMVLLSVPVTPAALARGVLTMAEAKGAALQRLAAPSGYSADLATGTGTDQYCLAAPLDGRPPLTSASPHMKLGEILGAAVRDATLEALRWQNGLEPSYTRGVFHALGRYGVRESGFFEEMTTRLSPADLELLRRNAKAALYEPLVGAAAHALAAVLDRVRHGTVPASAARDATVQQAAVMAANLAACPDRWSDFRARLHAQPDEGPKALVLAALALGWQEKWRRP